MKLFILLIIPAAFLPGAVFQIGIINYAFSPASQMVAPGDTVRWINQSSSPHTSTSGAAGVPDSFWNSGTILPGDTFTLVIGLAPNAYPYYCAFHWQMGMTGTITVGVGVGENDGRARTSAGAAALEVRPNPFSRSARIDYRVPEPGWTEVAIFNRAGRKATTLVQGFLPAGNRTLTWDGRDASGVVQPEGVYFVRLMTGAGRVTQKILLFK